MEGEVAAPQLALKLTQSLFSAASPSIRPFPNGHNNSLTLSAHKTNNETYNNKRNQKGCTKSV
jgi:hypothetical protein